MTIDLDHLLAQDAFAPIDRHFGRFIARGAAAGGDPRAPLCGLAAALASAALGRGSVCLPLDRPPTFTDGLAGLPSPWPDLAAWRSALVETGVASNGSAGRPPDFRPLVIDDGGRLYLRRYFDYEVEVACAIRERAAAAPPTTPDWPAGAEAWFPDDTGEGVRRAASVALGAPLLVLSGAPGTGKTTTVLRILALLETAGPPRSMALVAPTGKAAKRLEESLRLGLEQLPLPADLAARLPRAASTIHRLLGARDDSAFFRHDRQNPLPHDVVVVDECSMADLPLLAKLFAALRPDARLILVGDHNQLAPVEAGTVFGDLVRAARDRSDSALARCTVELDVSHRFAADSAIHALCEAVRAGDPAKTFAVLRGSAAAGVTWRPVPRPADLGDALAATPVWQACTAALTQDDPVAALAMLGRARLLAAVRAGPAGVEGLNALLESRLRAAGLVGPPGAFTDGRLVLVTRNHYALQLFNGDVGLLRRDPNDGRLHAHFPADGGSTRRVAAAQLPDHEPAFALTVHRSQGSEFDHVLVVLPEAPHPLLTRELLYTAVSRARLGVEIWASEAAIAAACQAGTARTSGLVARLAAD